MSLCIDVAHCPILATSVDELRREDVARAQRHTILRKLFIDDRETIAGLDIEHEVDVVLEYFREIERHSIGKSGVRGCLEQRAVDPRARSARARFERILEYVRNET